MKLQQILQNFRKFEKFQLDYLVDFEKCCKAHIYLHRSAPIQPKTSDNLPKFFQKMATTELRAEGLEQARVRVPEEREAPRQRDLISKG